MGVVYVIRTKIATSERSKWNVKTKLKILNINKMKSDYELLRVFRRDDFEDYSIIFALVKNKKTGELEKRFIIDPTNTKELLRKNLKS